MNLRERAERDLAVTLEGRWALPVNLTAPDGSLQAVRGQILYDIVRMNPDTGEDVVISTPVVTLRRSSLDRVPVAGENWLVEIPIQPAEDAPTAQYVLSPTRPPEGGRSLGFIRLYLQEVEQSV